MTYSELLHSVSFDEIAPCLQKYIEAGESLLGYKVHYDMLRVMQPVASEEEDERCKAISIEKYEPYEGEDLPEGLLQAWPLEGQIWENSLAKELVVAEDVKASQAEIAACCIWHSSFYGFVEEDREQTFTHWDEIAQQKEYSHYLKKYGSSIPTPNKLLKIKRTLHNRVKHKMRYLRSRNKFKDLDDNLPTPTKWRHWKRWVIKDEYRRIVTGIGRFVERTTEPSQPSVEPGDATEFLTCLFNAPSAYIDTLQSYTDDEAKRIDYICELLDKYKAIPSDVYHRAIFCVYVSLEYDLTMDELGKLTNCLFEGINQLAWGLKYDSTLGHEIRIDIALY